MFKTNTMLVKTKHVNRIHGAGGKTLADIQRRSEATVITQNLSIFGYSLVELYGVKERVDKARIFIKVAIQDNIYNINI